MIALIPGLEDTLAYLRPPSRGEGGNFAQVLAEVKAPAAPAATPGPISLPGAPARYEVQPGDNLSRIAKKLGYADPMVLARANRLPNPDVLQVGQVLTLPENTPAAGVRSAPARQAAAPSLPLSSSLGDSRSKSATWVRASWYGSQHHGRRMANGQPFNMFADTVAHRTLPLGTEVTLSNPRTGQAVQARVTDRGPFVAGRDLDVSYGVAKKLGMLQAGVARLKMEGG
uniref:Probable endolytic peptidoglycan transglycosylase RlpA n=1 Tax=Desulfobacca acetoxidans TaxID=60893 RepID=A0A7V4G7X5_9BACT